MLLLLAIICYYSGANWFFTVASAVVFGLAVVFLPFAVRSEPVRELLGDFSRPLAVIAVDVILFANMMNMISLHSKSIIKTGTVLVMCIAGAWLLVSAIKEKKGETK